MCFKISGCSRTFIQDAPHRLEHWSPKHHINKVRGHMSDLLFGGISFAGVLFGSISLLAFCLAFIYWCFVWQYFACRPFCLAFIR